VIAYLDGNRRRLGELVDELLPDVGYIMPEGSYLTWLDFTNTGLDGHLSDFFRERAGVAVTEGSYCGNAGRRSIRFNIAMPRPILEQAVDQMACALRDM
jgi:cystathionine beta-lyase